MVTLVLTVQVIQFMLKNIAQYLEVVLVGLAVETLKAVRIITDIIDKKAATVGYEFQLSATGNITVDAQTFPTNSTAGTFSTLLGNGTLTGWLVFPNAALNADQADEFSTDAVQGAKVVIVRNGLVEAFSSNEGLLQLVVGNVTYERAGASTWNSAVNIAGFTTTVQVYAFDRTSRTSSAAWVYKGNF